MPKTVITGLAAAALIIGAALAPIAASAAGGGHGGGGGNWPQSGAWNWPEGAGPACDWVQVKYISHHHAYWRSVKRC